MKYEEDELNNFNSADQKIYRSILSRIARIYDLIGFATALLIRAKIGIQE